MKGERYIRPRIKTILAQEKLKFRQMFRQRTYNLEATR